MVQFTATAQLLEALSANGIKPEDYKPAYGGESVGLDLYNAGPDIEIPSSHILNSDPPVNLYNDLDWERMMIPTGIRIALPVNYAAIVFQRGSIRKTPLIHRAGVIDPGYKGEIFIPVLNFSTDPYIVKESEKLPFQIVVMPVVSQFCYIDTESYEDFTKNASRGMACLGSSDVPSVKETSHKQVATESETNTATLKNLLFPTAGYL